MSSRSFIFINSYSSTRYTLPTNGTKWICQRLIFVKISGEGIFFWKLFHTFANRIYLSKKQNNYTIHIGKRIKEVLELQGHNVVWLASQISCERSNIYNMFKRDNIGVDLLQKVCCALGHDFFKELSNDLQATEGFSKK